ncbi:uncharacterized protein LOC114859782 [Betta splendens]|uniref:Uncharacterized protein LOC114859782 n=1 Tax=Betta splendens TaxID=158456 RepID=A0A6P7N6L9_BETSP|nr:uncharacterized protein LOC114859782 [Betta splendens]
MRNLVSILILTQLYEACADVAFVHLSRNQTLELTCSPQRDLGGLTAFSLLHRGARGQTTVLAMAEGGELRVNPEHRGRVRLRGGLASPRLNVSIARVERGDAGLYAWELSYGGGGGGGSADVAGAHRAFLVVDAAGGACHCSHRYLPVTASLFTAAGLLLVALSWMLVQTCKVKRRPRPPHPPPIYEEMSRKQQRAGTPQNNYEAPAHLEEVHFPVYANPSIQQPQDEYYASPRQLAVRA